MIGAKVINVTLTITNKDCDQIDQSIWPKLQETVTDSTWMLFI